VLAIQAIQRRLAGIATMPSDLPGRRGERLPSKALSDQVREITPRIPANAGFGT